jgi:hypothetical protein
MTHRFFFLFNINNFHLSFKYENIEPYNCAFSMVIIFSIGRVPFSVVTKRMNWYFFPKLFSPTVRKKVLVVTKHFWNSRHKAENLQNIGAQVKGQ